MESAATRPPGNGCPAATRNGRGLRHTEGAARCEGHVFDRGGHAWPASSGRLPGEAARRTAQSKKAPASALGANPPVRRARPARKARSRSCGDVDAVEFRPTWLPAIADCASAACRSWGHDSIERPGTAARIAPVCVAPSRHCSRRYRDGCSRTGNPDWERVMTPWLAQARRSIGRSPSGESLRPRPDDPLRPARRARFRRPR